MNLIPLRSARKIKNETMALNTEDLWNLPIWLMASSERIIPRAAIFQRKSWQLEVPSLDLGNS
jgi:hypothetical protein